MLPSDRSFVQGLDSLVRAAADLFEAHTAALFLASGGTDPLLCLRAFHSLSDLVIPDACLEEGQGLIGWVYREQKPLHVTRFDNDSVTLGLYRQDAGIKAMLAVPLPEGSGVLVLDSRNRYQFPDKTRRIALDLARLAYDLIGSKRSAYQAWLYRQILDWQRKWLGVRAEEALCQLMDILDMEIFVKVQAFAGGRYYRMKEAIDRHGAVLREPLRRFGGKVSVEKGLAGWILRHERAILLDRFGRQRLVSHLVEPDDGLGKGSVVLGLYMGKQGHGDRNVVGISGPEAVIFRGETDITLWPKDMPAIIRHQLELMGYGAGE
jgi:hypothetical protein